MTKEARIYNGERTVFSISGDGKTEQFTCKTMKLEHPSNTIYKIKVKMDERPKRRTGYYKTPRGKHRTLIDINHSNTVLNSSSRVMERRTKINKWDLIKLKTFRTAKETINKTKRQPKEWEEIFAKDTT